GIFSGTLSWLFLQFDGTVPFTDLVDQAWQQGLTEPDPRVDLSMAASGTRSISSTTSGIKEGSTRGRPIPSILLPTGLRNEASRS
ncbi:hypothetical protein MJI20_28770, partial [Salmonella enterica subsp. enterica serovar Anatum]|nr:hypothetical protein [Salmonella enterica subsp. enterica serovar Anatum]